MKKLKYLVSLILCVALTASCLMAPALALEKRYNSNWVYWSQGASGIGGYMNSSGCRIVADAKLLKEAGIAPAAFDPDIYAQWANQNGYYGSKTQPLSAYVGEQGVKSDQGGGPVGYAKANGKTLYYCGQIDFSAGSSRTTRVNQVMNWLQDGYYVILGCGTHHAYVGREMSLSKGTPYILDSGSSYITGPITAYKDYSAANFSYVRLYSTTSSKKVISVSAVTTSANTITETSAILRGSVSSTGAKMTQCGMLLGTSSQDMTRLGYDSINTYGTTCYYSTSKYGRTLTPGTTYYYQVYAVVDGMEYKGDIKSFTTAGTAPKPSLSVSLSQDSMMMQDNVSKTLAAVTTPNGLAVNWRSSDPTVATVTNGRITALKAGTTTITASVASGGQTAFAICQVTVTATQTVCTTHVKGKYLWYAAEHPHYDHYTCAVCGEQFRDTTTNNMPTCEICNPQIVVDVKTQPASNITSTSAQLNGSLSILDMKRATITESGMYLGTSTSNMTLLYKSSASSTVTASWAFVDTDDLITLKRNTTYYYYYYVVVDGKTIKGSVVSFKTLP